MINGLGEYIPTPNTLALYHLNNLNDSSINAKNLSVGSGTPNLTLGRFRYCYEFLSASTHRLYYSGTLLGDPTAYTVSAWFYPYSFPSAGSYKAIFGNWSGSTGRVSMLLRNNGGVLSIVTEHVATGPVVYLPEIFISKINCWYNVMAVWNGTTAYLYINGRKGDAKNVNNLIASSSPNLNIGSYYVNNLYFDGKIDEIIMENRAWSPAEIALYYNLTKGNYNMRDNIARRNRKFLGYTQSRTFLSMMS
jgi:hypothetical protein